MHELALAQSVVRIVEEEAALQQVNAVTAVVLEIGALSCVDPHALEFSFQAATRGTIASAAVLKIKKKTGAARCFECERDVAVQSRTDSCPVCGSNKLIVIGGDEMKVKAVEVN